MASNRRRAALVALLLVLGSAVWQGQQIPAASAAPDRDGRATAGPDDEDRDRDRDRDRERERERRRDRERDRDAPVPGPVGDAGAVPDGALTAEQIARQPFLSNGSGSARLVGDGSGTVLETSIEGRGPQRAEYVLHRAGPHTDVVYEFRARYVEGEGALINQWHQPTGDKQGPAAAVAVDDGQYVLNYTEGGQERREVLFPVDGAWRTWRLEARWSHGGDGYLRLFADGEQLFTMQGNNSKDSAPEDMGATFKVGTYARPKDLTMQYAWASARS